MIIVYILFCNYIINCVVLQLFLVNNCWINVLLFNVFLRLVIDVLLLNEISVINIVMIVSINNII